jgi:hypothetical protein
MASEQILLRNRVKNAFSRALRTKEKERLL